MHTISLPVPSGFAERGGVKSQTIKRDQFPQRAVIFAGSDFPDANDFRIHELTSEARIEWLKLGEDDPTRFYDIHGGYFFSLDSN
ncbi:MAG: hypothetical protein AAF206_02815, partial [Bacteroidota bacterium]